MFALNSLYIKITKNDLSYVPKYPKENSKNILSYVLLKNDISNNDPVGCFYSLEALFIFLLKLILPPTHEKY